MRKAFSNIEVFGSTKPWQNLRTSRNERKDVLKEKTVETVTAVTDRSLLEMSCLSGAALMDTNS